MPTFEEYRVLAVDACLDRLQRTPGDLERAISGKTDTELARRPDVHNWSAKEIVCHLRDVEELFQIRFHTVVALDEPHILVLGASPEQLAAWRIGGSIGHPSIRCDGLRNANTSATTPVRLLPHFSGAEPRC
ncbi:DinB family protein [Candidatus Uhrbacteria bacterium]|nr:DinB family protein [Candidatus Uhrbacteria bacterium]